LQAAWRGAYTVRINPFFVCRLIKRAPESPTRSVPCCGFWRVA
jgi:hypothetical protein